MLFLRYVLVNLFGQKRSDYSITEAEITCHRDEKIPTSYLHQQQQKKDDLLKQSATTDSDESFQEKYNVHSWNQDFEHLRFTSNVRLIVMKL